MIPITGQMAVLSVNIGLRLPSADNTTVEELQKINMIIIMDEVGKLPESRRVFPLIGVFYQGTNDINLEIINLWVK